MFQAQLVRQERKRVIGSSYLKSYDDLVAESHDYLFRSSEMEDIFVCLVSVVSTFHILPSSGSPSNRCGVRCGSKTASKCEGAKRKAETGTSRDLPPLAFNRHDIAVRKNRRMVASGLPSPSSLSPGIIES